MDRRKIVRSLINFLIIFTFVWIPVKTFSQEIKVMTFNIYHGVNMNGQFDLDAIAEIINKENPDFVALQEVDKNTGRTQHTDIPEILGQKTQRKAFFGKAMDFDEGEYGIAILTKYPVNELFLKALPSKKNEEPRTSLMTQTKLESDIFLNFVTTHLDYKEKEHLRNEQVNELINTYLKYDTPTIVAGDFNDVPQSKPIDTLLDHCTAVYEKTGIQPTFPSDDPKRKIDYIFVYPKHKWKIISSKVIPGKTSDHLAFVAVLRLLR